MSETSGRGTRMGEIVDFDRAEGTVVIHGEEGLMTLRSMTKSDEFFDALEETRRGWPRDSTAGDDR